MGMGVRPYGLQVVQLQELQAHRFTINIVNAPIVKRILKKMRLYALIAREILIQ